MVWCHALGIKPKAGAASPRERARLALEQGGGTLLWSHFGTGTNWFYISILSETVRK